MKLIILFIIAFQTLAVAPVNNQKNDYPVVRAQIIKETKVMTKEMKAQHPETPVCHFARKDYDSPGFGLVYRDGFYIKGQFGCVYYCGYQGKAYYVTHVYRKEYFDAAYFTKDTGGPKRAKWFICPHSVKEDSWKAIYDGPGQTGTHLGYQAEEDNSFFEPRQMPNIPELQLWEKSLRK